MNSTQEAAFRAGAGVDASTLELTLASFLIVGIMIWVSWVALGALKAWRLGDLEIYDFLWQIMRCCIVLAVVGYYVQ